MTTVGDKPFDGFIDETRVNFVGLELRICEEVPQQTQIGRHAFDMRFTQGAIGFAYRIGVAV